MSHCSSGLASALAVLLLGCQDGMSEASRCGWDKDGVRRRLEALDKVSRDPKKFKEAYKVMHGAMCYEPRSNPDRVEYVHPSCGRRTLYVRQREGRREMSDLVSMLDRSDLAAMRAKVTGITDFKVALDETRLCSHCAPPGTEPSLGLVVTLPDRTVVRTWGIHRGDLDLLVDFAKCTSDKAIPPELLLSVSRIQALLGQHP